MPAGHALHVLLVFPELVPAGQLSQMVMFALEKRPAGQPTQRSPVARSMLWPAGHRSHAPLWFVHPNGHPAVHADCARAASRHSAAAAARARTVRDTAPPPREPALYEHAWGMGREA